MLLYIQFAHIWNITPYVLYSGTSDKKDTPNKGHNRKKPLYKGHTLRSTFLYILTSEESATSP